MIGFVDKWQSHDFEFLGIEDKGFIDKLLSVKVILLICLATLAIPILIIILPFVFILSLTNNILNLFQWLYRKYFKPNFILKEIKEYQKELDKQNLLYLSEHFKSDSFLGIDLKRFIKDFLYSYNKSNTTRSCPYGYQQCDRNRRRSLGDIYRICKYYYPNITLLQVLKVLIDLLNSRKIGTCFCGTIRKQVYYTNNMEQYDGSTMEWGSKLTLKSLKENI